MLELTGILLPNALALDKSLDEELSPKRAATRRQQSEDLRTRAWVFYAAEEDDADTAKTQRDELAVRVAGHDRTLLLWATPVFDGDAALRATLRDIQRNTGRRDDADARPPCCTTSSRDCQARAVTQQLGSPAKAP